VLKKVLMAVGTAALASVGGSLFHPFGTAGVPGTNQTILREAQIDPETLAMVQRACRSCHSQQTEWPWYSHLAPVSWLLARDVQQARAHMNLSQWQDYSANDRVRLLSEIGSAVRSREMPVQRYLWLHPEARLTDMERQQIYRWTRVERSRINDTPNSSQATSRARCATPRGRPLSRTASENSGPHSNDPTRPGNDWKESGRIAR
jgi:hypothetical protein